MYKILTRLSTTVLPPWSLANFVRYIRATHLTSQEVAIALRPFYFAVHPDLFGQHPKERKMNENSLKLLNEYIECMLAQKRQALPETRSIMFYLRYKNDQNVFRTVNVELGKEDLLSTIRAILYKCNLSSEYLDKLATARPSVNTHPSANPAPDSPFPESSFFTSENYRETVKQQPKLSLGAWLTENLPHIHELLTATKPLREEVTRVSASLKSSLGLKRIVWDCGWGLLTFRGCLLAFQGLVTQHPHLVSIVQGRTLVFGQQTGLSFEGHIILNTSDVRNNWLEMIQRMPESAALLPQVPAVEQGLSEVLRGIRLQHRRFQPAIMVQTYLRQLRKLTAAIYRYRWKHGLPHFWPRRLSHLQIVVEGEAGPLMLSPTGQFIVPASCPAPLLVDFISKNMEEAIHMMELYRQYRSREWKCYSQCLEELGLESLNKDDNVTPDRMVACCESLLESPHIWQPLLVGCRIRVSHYYSILTDGEICIPWNWRMHPT